MEGFLLFALAEVITITTLTRIQRHAQQKILEKWFKGELTLQELQLLKTRLWFQRRVLPPPKETIPLSKKNN